MWPRVEDELYSCHYMHMQLKWHYAVIVHQAYPNPNPDVQLLHNATLTACACNDSCITHPLP